MTRDYSRQSDLVPEDKLVSLPVTVVGVGAVGRNVAMQLASIGVRRINLVDFDVVEATNVTTQGFYASQIGLSKVEACTKTLMEIDDSIEVKSCAGRWRPRGQFNGDGHGAIFCCVDKMEARALIHRAASKKCSFWADARMLGETCYVLCAHTKQTHKAYAGTLFSEDEVEPGRCTARATIYCASFCAAAMVHQFCRWLRGLTPMSVGGSLLEFMPIDVAAIAPAPAPR